MLEGNTRDQKRAIATTINVRPPDYQFNIMAWTQRQADDRQTSGILALEAERKMGEMLEATERANIARDKKKAELPGVTPPPTLKQIGISKRVKATTGSRFLMLAGL